MGELAGTIFTILLFIAAFLGSGAYAVLSMADFRAARRGFWAAAISFAAIGLVLGIMTTWPLPVRMLVCAVFFCCAGAGLIWVLDYLKVREALGVERESAALPQSSLTSASLHPVLLKISNVRFDSNGIGEIYVDFRVENHGNPTTLRNWELSIAGGPIGLSLNNVKPRIPPFPRYIPDPSGRTILTVDDFINDPILTGVGRDAAFTYSFPGNSKEVFGDKGTKFTLSVEDMNENRSTADYILP